MKKYQAVNVSTYLDVPKTMDDYKVTYTDQKFDRGSGRIDIQRTFVFKNSSVRKIYTVPAGRTARLMVIRLSIPGDQHGAEGVLYRPEFTGYGDYVKKDTSSGSIITSTPHKKLPNADRKSPSFNYDDEHTMIKINNLEDSNEGAFIFGGLGATYRDRLPSESYVGTNMNELAYPIKVLKECPVYLNAGDSLYLRTVLGVEASGVPIQTYSSSYLETYTNFTWEDYDYGHPGIVYLSLMEEYEE